MEQVTFISWNYYKWEFQIKEIDMYEDQFNISYKNQYIIKLRYSVIFVVTDYVLS